MMAFSADLKAGVVLGLGVPMPTVNLVHRSLRDANLVSSSGRGRGGAKQTSHDAAAIVVGAVAAPQVNLSATTVRHFNDLVSRSVMSGPSLYGFPTEVDGCGEDYWGDDCPFERLKSLGNSHKFMDALAAIIVESGKNHKDSYWHFSVELFMPNPRAVVRAFFFDGGSQLFRKSIFYRHSAIPMAGNADMLRDAADFMEKQYADLPADNISRRFTVSDSHLRPIALSLMM